MNNSPLVESYQNYKSNPNVETYEIFGQELLYFIKAILVNKYRSNYERIEDALGDACIKIISKLDTFKGAPEKFPSWVITIAFNQAAMIGRRDLIREEFQVEERDGVVETTTSLDAKLDLQKIMNQLSEEDKHIVEAIMHGDSLEEIARHLNVPLGTIKSKWSRIKDKFRTRHGWQNTP